MDGKYYCTNCGVEMDPEAAICVKCGHAKGVGKRYCSNCGTAVTDDKAVVCLTCGHSLSGNGNTAGDSNSSGAELFFGKRATGNEQVGSKSRMAAGLLYIFLSQFGIGDFYLGYTKTGLIRLAVFAVGLWIVGIGLLVNFVWGIIAAVNVFSDKTLDANGFALKK